MKSIGAVLFVILCVLVPGARAQSGACLDIGTYINYHDYINYSSSAGGDVEIGPAGVLEIGALGLYDIYGAVLNRGTIEVQSGGKLNIWGDVANQAAIILHAGAQINFYGKTWTNTSTATLTDGAPANTVPGGDLSFIAARPGVPAQWITSSSCLTAYSGGDALQYLDGGSIPMDINMRLGNANNVEMINSTVRIEGKLQWDSANAHLVLGNQDLVMTQNATQDGFREDRFAVTNGTGHVVKENYTGNWIFPVGIAALDYTPAAIDNALANTMHVLVQDYATSASVDTGNDGMDRTWNIYADIATGNSVINLQHNTITNQPAYNDGYNFVTRWGSTAPNTTGDYTVSFTTSPWQTNNGAPGTTGNLSSTGTVAGSSMRSRTYTDFALSAGDYIAFYSKSSDPFHPLPIQLVSFSATANNCDVMLGFSTGVETGINKIQVQHSTDGTTFSTLATFSPKGSHSSYSFTHINAPDGRNFYRLVLIEPSGDYTRSETLVTRVSCDGAGPKLELFPNPADNFITVAGMTGPTEIRIMNELGRLMLATSSIANKEIIDISLLPSATYVVSVFAQGQVLAHLKLIKR